MKTNTYKLGQLLTIKNGKDYKHLNAGNIPVFGSGGYMCMVDKFLYDQPSILLPRKGTLSNIQYYDKPFWTVDTCFYSIVNTDLADAYYLFWYLKQLDLSGLDTGASIPSMTIKTYNSIKISLPPLPLQRRIASILSAYDNLIEANSRRIKILEQMAENLYKEWFVRFRLPGHEKEEKENGLPKGWNIAPLFSEYNTTSGGTPSRTNLNYYSGSIPWIKTGELQGTFILDTEEHITEEAVRKSSAKLIPAYSLLIAMYAGANVGNLGINSIVATCNQACCVITTKGRYPLYYLLFFLQTQKRFLQSISFGAAQQNISQDIVKKLKVLFPPSTLCDTFNKLVSPYLQQCELLLKENQFLTRQRDLLLPRLMSGQLTPLTNQ